MGRNTLHLSGTRHVRSVDVGAFCKGGAVISLGNAEEFFTLTEYGPGSPYALDLKRLRDTGDIQGTDLQRADALCDYLSGIHATRGLNPDTTSEEFESSSVIRNASWG